MPRYREFEKTKAKETVREKLLSAAADEFSAHGYEGALIDRISVTAGFGKGTVYNYFPGKKGLMEALLTDFAGRHCVALTGTVPAAGGPEERLGAFFREGFEWIRRNLPQARIIVATLFGSNEEFRMILYRAYDPLFRILRDDILGEGMEAGIYRRVDADKVSGLIMSIYLGTSAQITGNGGALPLQAEFVTDFVSAGLRIPR